MLYSERSKVNNEISVLKHRILRLEEFLKHLNSAKNKLDEYYWKVKNEIEDTERDLAILNKSLWV